MTSVRPSEMEINEVRLLIRSAFASKRITPPKIVVDMKRAAYDPEMSAMHGNFSGKKWTDIGYATLCRQCDSLPLFNSEAFIFYMPAFLCACLEFEREGANTLCDLVMMSLNPVEDRHGRLSAYKLERLAGFGPNQRQAIARFVALFQNWEPNPIARSARRAFEFYWKEFA
jgi:hypothetical protein